MPTFENMKIEPIKRDEELKKIVQTNLMIAEMNAKIVMMLSSPIMHYKTEYKE